MLEFFGSVTIFHTMSRRLNEREKEERGMTRQVEQKNISSPEQGSFGLNWRPVTGQEHFGAVEFVSLLYHMFPKYHGEAIAANLPNEKTGRKEFVISTS